jgi:tocopherol O-methyltransferase
VNFNVTPRVAWSPDLVRRHYDFMAGMYRRYWGDHIHHGLFLKANDTPERAQLRMLEHCAALAGPLERRNVLDVGCGHGGTAVFLAKRFGCCVTGLTISPRQAQLARRTAQVAGIAEHVRIEVADATAHTFPANAFEVVWTMESSEHFPDKAAYFGSVARALKPGGKLLLAAWTGSMHDPAVRRVAEIYLCPGLQTAGDYCTQIAAAGLRVLSLQDVSASVQQTWDICRARIRPFVFLLNFLPEEARSFARGIDVIRDAYAGGALSYTIAVAQREAGHA